MQLQRELENPGISRAQNCAEIGRAQCSNGAIEVGVINHIERLKASLHPDPLPVSEPAAQGCVELEIAGANRCKSSQITKRPQRVRSKRRAIQPRCDASVSRI